MVFYFTNRAEKQFKKLPPEIQKELIKKVQRYKNNSDLFFLNLKIVKNISPFTHRLRVGNYRMLLKFCSEQEWEVLRVGHRKNIYTKK